MPQPPNLQKMLAEAQAMLAQQQEAQEALKAEKVDASTGGGSVKIVMTGDLRVESLTIDPDAVDPEDVEMLQDLIIAALNEAIRSVTGSSLRLVYELRAAGEIVAPSAAAAPALSEDDLVQRFKDEFDAEELPPEPEEQT